MELNSRSAVPALAECFESVLNRRVYPNFRVGLPEHHIEGRLIALTKSGFREVLCERD